ncbi:MAG: DUF4271 domain-containing protein [Sporocytophaga sp.]|nr:DUF4271 domain-containing protein [Sporocytophaga sp.]
MLVHKSRNKTFYFRAILFLILALLSHLSYSAETEFKIVKDLSSEWKIYNADINGYVPFIKGRSQNSHFIFQWIDLDKYSGYHLQVKAAPRLSLFVNNELYYTNVESKFQDVAIPIKDLLKKTIGGRKDLLTIYQPDASFNDGAVSIGHFPEKLIELAPAVNIVAKKQNFLGDLVMALFISSFAIIAILKNRFPKSFSLFFQKSEFSLSASEELLSSRIIDFPLLLVIILNAFSLSILIFSNKESENFVKFLTLIDTPNLPLLSQFALSTFVIIFLIIIKYLLITFLGWIFDLNKLITLHFYEFLSIMLKVNLFVVPVVLILLSINNFHPFMSITALTIILLIIFFLLILKVSYIIFKFSNYRNLYLFSYLCISEILPFIVITKLLASDVIKY